MFPVVHDKVNISLHNLSKVIKEEGIKQIDSVKAGVHVHINVQDLTIRQVMLFLSVYYPLETVLTKFCGENRESNLFCLRMRDAEYTISKLEIFLQDKKVHNLHTDELRYGALNFQSLFKYGSVEFRAMESTPSFDKILKWCDIIMSIKQYALKVKTGKDMMYALSGYGGHALMLEIFGEELTKLLEYPNMEKDMIKDARLVQNFSHMLG